MINTKANGLLYDAIVALNECFLSDNSAGKFNFIYPMTTENITGYLKHMNNVSKTLTVAGSGDHLLNCIAMGAMEIDFFDINPITYYLTQLKFAMLNLSRKDFIEFFTVDVDWDTICSTFFNVSTYNVVRRYISLEAQTFWDTFYKLLDAHNLKPQQCELFRHIRYSRETIVGVNYYLNEDIYPTMKDMVKGTCSTFYRCNLADLGSSIGNDAVYNTVLFSNISDYIKGIFPTVAEDKLLCTYNDFVDSFKASHLALGGEIAFAYIYEAGTGPGWTVIDNLANCKASFPNTRWLFIPAICRAYKNLPACVDAVLIKTKEVL